MSKPYGTSIPLEASSSERSTGRSSRDAIGNVSIDVGYGTVAKEDEGTVQDPSPPNLHETSRHKEDRLSKLKSLTDIPTPLRDSASVQDMNNTWLLIEEAERRAQHSASMRHEGVREAHDSILNPTWLRTPKMPRQRRAFASSGRASKSRALSHDTSKRRTSSEQRRPTSLSSRASDEHLVNRKHSETQNYESEGGTDDNEPRLVVNELSFQVDSVDVWGKTQSKTHCLQLDTVEVNKAWYFLNAAGQLESAEDDGAYHTRLENTSRKFLAGTKFTRAPSEDDLRPIFAALWDWSHSLLEVYTENKTLLKEATTELNNLKHKAHVDAPKTPDSLRVVGDIREIGTIGTLLNLERENAYFRLEEKRLLTEREQELRHLEQLETNEHSIREKMQSLKNEAEISVRDILKLQNEVELLQNQLQNHQGRSQSQVRELSQELHSTHSRLFKLTAAYDHIRNQLFDTQQKLNMTGKELEIERNARRDLEKHSEAVEAQLMTRQATFGQDMQQSSVVHETHLQRANDQVDELERMCQSTLEWMEVQKKHQLGQQKALQTFFEKERVKMHNEVLTTSENPAVEDGSITTHDTMEGLTAQRKRSNQRIGFMPTSTSVQSNLARSHSRKPKKARPAPLKADAKSYGKLPEISRSPRPGGHPSLTTQLRNSSPLSRRSVVAADALPKQPPDPTANFASQSSVARTSRQLGSGAQTPLWVDIDKDPYELRDNARVLFEIVGFDRDRQKFVFKQGDIVSVRVDSLQDSWVVSPRGMANAARFLLPRIALSLLCPHDYEYIETYFVIKHWPRVSDAMPTGYVEVRPANEGIVECAHSAKAGDLGYPGSPQDSIFRCIKTQDGVKKGWVCAKALTDCDRLDIPGFPIKECFCEQPQPYHGHAQVLEDCTGWPASLELKIGEVVDLAHLDSDGQGKYCVRSRVTSQQGFIDAVKLRVLSRPVTDNVLMLTPRYFDIRGSRWIEGESKRFSTAMREDPKLGGYRTADQLPFSLDAKKAWENDIQGSNPRHLKWDDAEAQSRRKRVFEDYDAWNGWQIDTDASYISRADHEDLKHVKRWGDVLPRNPWVGMPGPHRLRSRSLVVPREGQHFIRGIGVGHQRLREQKMLGDGDLPDRGYESDPTTAPAKRKDHEPTTASSRNMLYKKIDGRMVGCYAADDFTETQIYKLPIWEHNGGPRDYYGKGGMNPVGSSYARRLLMRTIASNTLTRQAQSVRSPRIRPSDLDDVLTSVLQIVNTSIDDDLAHSLGDLDAEALSEIKKDWAQGFALVYQLTNVNGLLENPDLGLTVDHRVEILAIEEKTQDETPWLHVRLLPTDDLSSRSTAAAKEFLVQASDLHYTEPCLRSAVLKQAAQGSTPICIVLMSLLGGSDGWRCLCNDEIFHLPSNSFELEPVERWPKYTDVLSILEAAAHRDQSPAAASASQSHVSQSPQSLLPSEESLPSRINLYPEHPKPQQWDFLFPIIKQQEQIARSALSVDVDDYVYVRHGVNRVEAAQYCGTFAMVPYAQGYVETQNIDFETLHLPMCLSQQDLDQSGGQWLIFLREEKDKVYCGLPDKSKRWFNIADLRLDMNTLRAVPLEDLGKDDLLSYDEAGEVDHTERETITTEEGLLDQIPGHVSGTTNVLSNTHSHAQQYYEPSPTESSTGTGQSADEVVKSKGVMDNKTTPLTEVLSRPFATGSQAAADKTAATNVHFESPIDQQHIISYASTATKSSSLSGGSDGMTLLRSRTTLNPSGISMTSFGTSDGGLPPASMQGTPKTSPPVGLGTSLHEPSAQPETGQYATSDSAADDTSGTRDTSASRHTVPLPVESSWNFDSVRASKDGSKIHNNTRDASNSPISDNDMSESGLYYRYEDYKDEKEARSAGSSTSKDKFLEPQAPTTSYHKTQPEVSNPPAEVRVTTKPWGYRALRLKIPTTVTAKSPEEPPVVTAYKSEKVFDQLPGIDTCYKAVNDQSLYDREVQSTSHLTPHNPERSANTCISNTRQKSGIDAVTRPAYAADQHNENLDIVNSQRGSNDDAPCWLHPERAAMLRTKNLPADLHGGVPLQRFTRPLPLTRRKRKLQKKRRAEDEAIPWGREQFHQRYHSRWQQSQNLGYNTISPTEDLMLDPRAQFREPAIAPVNRAELIGRRCSNLVRGPDGRLLSLSTEESAGSGESSIEPLPDDTAAREASGEVGLRINTSVAAGSVSDNTAATSGDRIEQENIGSADLLHQRFSQSTSTEARTKEDTALDLTQAIPPIDPTRSMSTEDDGLGEYLPGHERLPRSRKRPGSPSPLTAVVSDRQIMLGTNDMYAATPVQLHYSSNSFEPRRSSGSRSSVAVLKVQSVLSMTQSPIVGDRMVEPLCSQILVLRASMQSILPSDADSVTKLALTAEMGTMTELDPVIHMIPFSTHTSHPPIQEFWPSPSPPANRSLTELAQTFEVEDFDDAACQTSSDQSQNAFSQTIAIEAEPASTCSTCGNEGLVSTSQTYVQDELTDRSSKLSPLTHSSMLDRWQLSALAPSSKISDHTSQLSLTLLAASQEIQPEPDLLQASLLDDNSSHERAVSQSQSRSTSARASYHLPAIPQTSMLRSPEPSEEPISSPMTLSVHVWANHSQPPCLTLYRASDLPSDRLSWLINVVTYIMYYMWLLFLFMSMWYARQEWVEANGLDRGSRLVQHQRAVYQGGGWEWVPWVYFKSIIAGLV